MGYQDITPSWLGNRMMVAKSRGWHVALTIGISSETAVSCQVYDTCYHAVASNSLPKNEQLEHQLASHNANINADAVLPIPSI